MRDIAASVSTKAVMTATAAAAVFVAPMVGKVRLNADEPDDAYALYGDAPVPPKAPGAVRVWVDGCFDMMHFGHANMLRQARKLGTELFVGCHSDEEIVRYKGPPIMRDEERYEALRACKWVDYVVENYPYCTRLKDIQRFDVDFVVHGDDVSVDLNGRNSYQEIIDAGRFKVVKRTDGISTTDLVSRMLLSTKSHTRRLMDEVRDGGEVDEDEEGSDEDVGGAAAATSAVAASSSLPLPRVNTTHYLTTSRKIAQFSNDHAPSAGSTIVYVDGSFDLFHIGHIRTLRHARALGDYLVVGIYEDAVIRAVKGSSYPIMNLNERVLGVLSCRYVDEVVMGVPYIVTRDLIDHLHVSLVVRGTCADEVDEAVAAASPYAVPRTLGILRTVDSRCTLTTSALIDRVLGNRRAFLARQTEKRSKDKQNEERKPDAYRHIEEIA